jgi:predicted heme/steroid binding protein
MDGMTPETLARFDGENGGEIYISFDGKVGGAGLGVDLETYQTDHVKNPGGSLSSGK